LKRKNWTPA